MDSENNNTDKKSSEPQDHNNVMYLIFCSWGAAVLMPWNAVASCLDYMDLWVGKNAGGMDVF
jgi:hypothetical protein